MAAKNRKRTNTDTSTKDKKVCSNLDTDLFVAPLLTDLQQQPRVTKAKEKAEAKAQADRAKEAQMASKSTPQSQATPLPSVDDAALYKAPMHQSQQQGYGQPNGTHSQAPTPQQQAPTPQQQHQQIQQQPMQMQSSGMMQPNGNIDVPQFSPSIDFSFTDLGDLTQFGIENVSTNSFNAASVSTKCITV